MVSCYKWVIIPLTIDISLINHSWLVVDLPLWKIWVRQLGWWHSQLNGNINFMFQTTNQIIIIISSKWVIIPLTIDISPINHSYWMSLDLWTIMNQLEFSNDPWNPHPADPVPGTWRSIGRSHNGSGHLPGRAGKFTMALNQRVKSWAKPWKIHGKSLEFGGVYS